MLTCEVCPLAGDVHVQQFKMISTKIQFGKYSSTYLCPEVNMNANNNHTLTLSFSASSHIAIAPHMSTNGAVAVGCLQMEPTNEP